MDQQVSWQILAGILTDFRKTAAVFLEGGVKLRQFSPVRIFKNFVHVEFMAHRIIAA